MIITSKNQKEPKWMLWLDIISTVLLIGLGLYLACSCGVQKPTTAERDSVRVEIHEHIIHDTVKVKLEPSIQIRETQDTVSVLRNDYAESEAAIRDGLLYHTLVTPDVQVFVPHTLTVHDTIKVASRTITEYVDVPRQPTKWENFLEICGWIFLGTILLAIAIIVLRICLHR